MNQKQNNVPVDATINIQQTAELSLCEGNQELKDYYLRLIGQMCPQIKPDQSDYARLCTLKRRIERLVEMLTLFEHSWTEEIPILQKAFFMYLTLENTPRKERQQVIDVWTRWSDFQFRLGSYRGLLSQFLQYHHQIGHELGSLLNPADAETSPEPQETTEKGGE